MPRLLSLVLDTSPSALAVAVKNLKPLSWAQEGLVHAKEKAYLNGDLPIADYFAYKSGHLAESAVPTLNADYHTAAEKLAKQRALIAGHRLAAVLTELLSDPQDQ